MASLSEDPVCRATCPVLGNPPGVATGGRVRVEPGYEDELDWTDMW
jgi:hypothetical protein